MVVPCLLIASRVKFSILGEKTPPGRGSWSFLIEINFSTMQFSTLVNFKIRFLEDYSTKWAEIWWVVSLKTEVWYEKNWLTFEAVWGHLRLIKILKWKIRGQNDAIELKVINKKMFPDPQNMGTGPVKKPFRGHLGFIFRQKRQKWPPRSRYGKFWCFLLKIQGKWRVISNLTSSVPIFSRSRNIFSFMKESSISSFGCQKFNFKILNSLKWPLMTSEGGQS